MKNIFYTGWAYLSIDSQERDTLQNILINVKHSINRENGIDILNFHGNDSVDLESLLFNIANVTSDYCYGGAYLFNGHELNIKKEFKFKEGKVIEGTGIIPFFLR